MKDVYFISHISFKRKLTPLQEDVFEEVALWAYACGIKDKARLQLMYKIIFMKLEDTIVYNKLVRKVIALT